MSYSQFTMRDIEQQFGITTDYTQTLWTNPPGIAPSSRLAETLQENVPLALAMQTEKARSELIIAPILVEVRRINAPHVSLFSGFEFNVDPAQGLVGVCDYLLTHSPQQLYIDHPVLAVIEAKKEDIVGGLAQCISALIAARLFNARANHDTEVIFGTVTTGEIWKFVRLQGQIAHVDVVSYYVDKIELLLGVFQQIVRG